MATTHAELEEWRNTGRGTVYVNRVTADGGSVSEPIAGKQDFLIDPVDRRSHTRAAKVWERDPFQNGTFFPLSENAKVASDQLAAARPKPPVIDDTPEETEIDQLKAQMAEQQLQIDRLLHAMSGSTEPFPEPEPEPVVERVPDPFETKANANILDDAEVAELLTTGDDDLARRWLATIDSEATLGRLLAEARDGQASKSRQVQVNDRLHQINPHAPGLPGTTSAAGPAGSGDSVAPPSEVDLDNLHKPAQFEPSVGMPNRVPLPGGGTAVEGIAGDMAMASAPPSHLPPPEPIPAHLASRAPVG